MLHKYPQLTQGSIWQVYIPDRIRTHTKGPLLTDSDSAIIFVPTIT